ncbi:MAG: DUF58 domain-containing protein [Jatrophihabitans sp.]|nr:MAG: DUF58 domain-containing protein [Jatrophihabitans sp.]
MLIGNRRSVSPDRVGAGSPVTVQLVLTNRSRLPTTRLMLEDRLPAQLPGQARFVLDPLAGRESRTVTYRLPHLPRGRYRVGPLQVRLTDPFGLVDIRRSFSATDEFVVRPIVESLPDMTVPLSHDLGDDAGSHSVGTHGADDASTREYRVGDDLRKIHWRSTARTGTVMVRQEERPWQGRVSVVLDLRAVAHAESAAPGRVEDERGRSSLEWAISAAASIGTHLLMSGRSLDLLDDPGGSGIRRLPDPGSLTDHLAVVTPARATSLVGASPAIAGAARQSALVAILGEVDPQTLRLLVGAHPRGTTAPAVALLLDTATWRAEGGHAGGTAHRSARALATAGWRTAVVRRGTTVAEAWTQALQADPVGVRA